MSRLILSVFLGFSLATAQFLDNNQDPPGKIWKAIDTKHFEIIYPAEISADAQRVANLVEHLYLPEIKTMTYPFKKLSLMLSTNSAIANGYVTLAPRRSEWYGTPFQLGSDDGDWYQLLATHEMRHMAQFGKLNNRGFNKVWNILGGETFLSVSNVLLIPRWFWEGDAVLMETLLTKGGRGRKPDFTMGIRALQLAGQDYSYYKAMLGSYRDFVPNPYPLGYLIVSYTRKHNYPELWSDVLGRSAFLSFFPFAFSASMKGISGQNAPTTYANAMSEFRDLWQAQQDSFEYTPCQILTKSSDKQYANYLFPQMGADNNIYALKNGPADAPSLIQIDKQGYEKQLCGIAPMYKISVNRHYAAWATYSAHWRWGKENYSDIILFDLKSRSTRKLTSKSKYFTPALSSDNKFVAAVEFSVDRQSSLVILDVETGTLVERVPNPLNRIIKSPAWSENGNKIVYTAQSASGKSLLIYDLKTDINTTLLQDTWLGITHPVFWKNFILFSSGLSGIDNIYALNRDTGQPYQITLRPVGAFNPYIIPGQNLLLFNDYSANGNQIAQIVLDSSDWIPIEQVKDVRLNYVESMVDQEQGGSIVDEEHLPKLLYTEQNYSSFRHLFNFHSWQLNPDSINLGAYIYSNNILNTMAAGAGLFYNKNERSLGYLFNASYGGWYPIIDFNVQKIHRSQDYIQNSEEQTAFWQETSAAIGLRLPIDLSSGKYQHSFYFSAAAQLTRVSGEDIRFTNDASSGIFVPLRYGLSYIHIQRYALQDVRRQWAQTLLALYEHTPLESDFKGAHLFARLKTYFPGLLKHHSLMLSSDYEWQDPLNYRFQPLIAFPRGYSYEQSDQFVKASLDYALPLFYPEWSLSAWFYLKRIKANLFYDYGINLERQLNTTFRSAGVEVLLDHHWFSTLIEFEGGYRFVYRLNDRLPRHEIVFRLPLD